MQQRKLPYKMFGDTLKGEPIPSRCIRCKAGEGCQYCGHTGSMVKAQRPFVACFNRGEYFANTEQGWNDAISWSKRND